MPTTRETILTALHARLQTLPATALRGEGLTTVPIFLLVPQVKLRKRLDLARDAMRVLDGLPRAIVSECKDTE